MSSGSSRGCGLRFAASATKPEISALAKASRERKSATYIFSQGYSA